MVQQKHKIEIRKRSFPDMVTRTINNIARGYVPRQIWIYGSYARGDIHQGSDLDLVIIKNTDKRFPDRIEDVLQFCTEPIAVELLVYTDIEVKAMLESGNAFLERVFSEGILIYEQQS